MHEPSFREFLSASFAALQRELPEVYRRMCTQLSGREVAIEVGHQVTGIRFASETLRLLASAARPQIDVRTTRAAILALIDGRATLAESLLDDTLHLRGTTDELLRFHDALGTYIHGAARAPSFPALLRAYRTAPPSTPIEESL